MKLSKSEIQSLVAMCCYQIQEERKQKEQELWDKMKKYYDTQGIEQAMNIHSLVAIQQILHEMEKKQFPDETWCLFRKPNSDKAEELKREWYSKLFVKPLRQKYEIDTRSGYWDNYVNVHKSDFDNIRALGEHLQAEMRKSLNLEPIKTAA